MVVLGLRPWRVAPGQSTVLDGSKVWLCCNLSTLNSLPLPPSSLSFSLPPSPNSVHWGKHSLILTLKVCLHLSPWLHPPSKLSLFPTYNLPFCLQAWYYLPLSPTTLFVVLPFPKSDIASTFHYQKEVSLLSFVLSVPHQVNLHFEDG